VKEMSFKSGVKGPRE